MMWREQSGCFEMLLAYFAENIGAAGRNKTYRDFLVEILTAHENFVSSRNQHPVFPVSRHFPVSAASAYATISGSPSRPHIVIEGSGPPSEYRGSLIPSRAYQQAHFEPSVIFLKREMDDDIDSNSVELVVQEQDGVPEASFSPRRSAQRESQIELDSVGSPPVSRGYLLTNREQLLLKRPGTGSNAVSPKRRHMRQQPSAEVNPPRGADSHPGSSSDIPLARSAESHRGSSSDIPLARSSDILLARGVDSHPGRSSEVNPRRRSEGNSSRGVESFPGRSGESSVSRNAEQSHRSSVSPSMNASRGPLSSSFSAPLTRPNSDVPVPSASRDDVADGRLSRSNSLTMPLVDDERMTDDPRISVASNDADSDITMPTMDNVVIDVSNDNSICEVESVGICSPVGGLNMDCPASPGSDAHTIEMCDEHSVDDEPSVNTAEGASRSSPPRDSQSGQAASLEKQVSDGPNPSTPVAVTKKRKSYVSDEIRRSNRRRKFPPRLSGERGFSLYYAKYAFLTEGGNGPLSDTKSDITVKNSPSHVNNDEFQPRRLRERRSAAPETEKLSEQRKSMTPKPSTIERPDNMFKCSICQKFFKYLNAKKKHELKHRAGKRFLKLKNSFFACACCEKLFSSLGNKIRHERSHAAGLDVSQENVTAPERVKDDVRKFKHKMKNYSCSYCSRTFAYRMRKVNHELRFCANRLQNTTTSCRFCTKSFVYLTSKIKHEMMHSEVKDRQSSANVSATRSESSRASFERPPFNVVQSASSTLDNPSTSAIIATNNSEVVENVPAHEVGSNKENEPAPDAASANLFQCSQCPKAFSKLKAKLMHERTGHGRRRRKVYVMGGKTRGRYFHCDFCPKSFKAVRHLNIHRRIHKKQDHVMEKKTKMEVAVGKGDDESAMTSVV